MKHLLDKKIPKGSAEWQFFTEFFSFRQKFYEPKQNCRDDQFWEEIVVAGSKLIEKYKNEDFAEFVKDIVYAQFDDARRRGNYETRV